MSESEQNTMHVVMSAYACDPEQGSESGAGWAMLQAASHVASHITVITRNLNAPTLEAAAQSLPCAVEIVRITTPFDSSNKTYARYVSWLFKATGVIRRLSETADVIHHVTFASDWMMPPISQRLSNRPKVVWGPVGGNTYPPLTALTGLGKSLLIKEIVRSLLTRTCRLITRVNLRGRVSTFISLNLDSTRSAPTGSSVLVHPNCILDYSYLGSHRARRCENKKKLLFVGRLLEWKGVLLALSAFELLEGDWELTIVGDGPARAKIEERTRARSQRVSLVGSCSRHEVAEHMSAADVLIFPSLHDSAGWVAAEAAATGLPVVCLELGGVSTMAGDNAVVVEARPVSSLPIRLAAAIRSASRAEYRPQEDWTLGSMIRCLESAYGPVLQAEVPTAR